MTINKLQEDENIFRKFLCILSQKFKSKSRILSGSSNFKMFFENSKMDISPRSWVNCHEYEFPWDSKVCPHSTLRESKPEEKDLFSHYFRTNLHEYITKNSNRSWSSKTEFQNYSTSKVSKIPLLKILSNVCFDWKIHSFITFSFSLMAQARPAL